MVTQQVKNADTTYTFSGTFKIFKDKPCEMANEQTLYEIGGSGGTESISFNNNELTIGTTECVADGGSSTYKKIQ